MTRVSNLYRLQAIDSQMDSRKARAAEIETLLAHHPALDQARADEQAARSRLEEARQALKRAEEETRRQQQHIQDTEKTLYGGGVSNPKELKDLQEETAALRRFLATLEERQLQTMLSCEEAEKTLDAASQKAADLAQARGETETALKTEAAAVAAEIGKLDLQREAAAAPILEADLEKYLELRKAKRGLAVARLDGGSCTACGVEPSTSRVDSARSGQDIVQCGNCGRILYLG